jgi:hypothetical protein
MIAKLIFVGAAADLCTAGGAFATTYDVTTLDAPGAEDTVAYGINNSGAVTGDYNGTTGTLGFVHSGGAYTALKYPGASGSSVTLGREINDSGAGAVPVAAAPEASTWAMLLAGFAGLAFAGYRRTRSKRFALGD